MSKAISVKQPWAYLICAGIKDIENRTWKTNYRGRLLIHASSRKDNSTKPLLTSEQYELAGGVAGYGKAIFGDRSAIIGSIEVIDCVQNHPSVWAEKGVYNWVLANPVLFENPILNVKGQLTFWEYDENAPGPEPKKRCGLCKHFRRPETTCPTFCALRMDALAKAKIKNRKTAKVGEKTEVCNQFEY